jgi:hypothetical protein
MAEKWKRDGDLIRGCFDNSTTYTSASTLLRGGGGGASVSTLSRLDEQLIQVCLLFWYFVIIILFCLVRTIGRCIACNVGDCWSRRSLDAIVDC